MFFIALAAMVTKGHPNGQAISCTDGAYTFPSGVDSSLETVTTTTHLFALAGAGLGAFVIVPLSSF